MATPLTKKDLAEFAAARPRPLTMAAAPASSHGYPSVTMTQFVGIVIFMVGCCLLDVAPWGHFIFTILGSIVFGRATYMDMTYVMRGIKPKYSWITKLFFIVIVVGYLLRLGRVDRDRD